MNFDGTSSLPRRTVLAVGVAGTAGMALAACSGSDSAGEDTGAGDPGSTSTTGGTQPTVPQAGGAATAVPVGGAAIVAAGKSTYVVAQPTEGQFVAHSAVCPHQGCLCNQIQADRAICPCHGSTFNAVTGEVLTGPAKTGLAKATVSNDGGTLMLS